MQNYKHRTYLKYLNYKRKPYIKLNELKILNSIFANRFISSYFLIKRCVKSSMEVSTPIFENSKLMFLISLSRSSPAMT